MREKAVQPQRQRRDDQRREVIGIVVVQSAQAPGLTSQLKAREDDADVHDRHREIDENQPVEIRRPANAARHHETHEDTADQFQPSLKRHSLIQGGRH